jgi:sulfoxide reductase catalytic subunit YedY
MLIKRKRGWELPESAATPEGIYLRRRELIKSIAAGSLLAATGTLALGRAARAEDADPSSKLYPAPTNEKYKLDRPLTPEKDATQYNNFYEFGTDKYIWKDAQKLPIRPWMVKFDGLVEKPFELGIDDLLAKMPLETRLYRHRCVEAWSMAVPWSGFPLKALVDLVKPLSGATYLQMQTFMNPKVAPEQAGLFYPWPYTEGLSMAEATNELAFIATGMYGHPIPKQNGAPLRLATPWKYGFKSVKSIVSFTFTDKRPETFWEKLGPSEYGFWANVNPAYAHPRWSQASEKVLGTGERVPTLIYNGYGEYVADIYKNMPVPPQKLFM